MEKLDIMLNQNNFCHRKNSNTSNIQNYLSHHSPISKNICFSPNSSKTTPKSKTSEEATSNENVPNSK
jgi:hypothetical protein